MPCTALAPQRSAASIERPEPQPMSRNDMPEIEGTSLFKPRIASEIRASSIPPANDSQFSPKRKCERAAVISSSRLESCDGNGIHRENASFQRPQQGENPRGFAASLEACDPSFYRDVAPVLYRSDVQRGDRELRNRCPRRE